MLDATLGSMVAVVFAAIVDESTVQSMLGWRVNLIAYIAELLVPSHAVSNDGGGGGGADGAGGDVDAGDNGGDDGRGVADTMLNGTAIAAGKIFCWFVQFPLVLLLSLVLMFVWRVYVMHVNGHQQVNPSCTEEEKAEKFI